MTLWSSVCGISTPKSQRQMCPLTFLWNLLFNYSNDFGSLHIRARKSVVANRCQLLDQKTPIHGISNLFWLFVWCSKYIMCMKDAFPSEGLQSRDRNPSCHNFRNRYANINLISILTIQSQFFTDCGENTWP
jgi:hypothetical protein